MIRTALILTALVSASAFAAEAADPAATLSAQQGTVLVNQGDEFVTATEAQPLQAGDRVMVMEGGSAEITFLDGCVYPMEAGSLLDVAAVSPCAGNVASVESIGPSYAAVLGSTRRYGGVSPYLVFVPFAAFIAFEVANADLEYVDGVLPPPRSP